MDSGTTLIRSALAKWRVHFSNVEGGRRKGLNGTVKLGHLKACSVGAAGGHGNGKASCGGFEAVVDLEAEGNGADFGAPVILLILILIFVGVHGVQRVGSGVCAT